MPELLSSKIIIGEEEPTIRTFPVLPTAVLAIQGVAEKGPIAEPQLITSFEEYGRYFGGYLANYQLALAVRSYFLNGGKRAYVSRVVHYTDPSVPSSKTSAKGYATLQTGLVADGVASHTGSNSETFDLEPGDTLVASVEGDPDDTLTLTATAGSVLDTTSYPVADQDTLTLKVTIDGGSEQTITFSGVTTTAAQIVDQINAQIYGARAVESGGQVLIESDKRGTNSSVAIGTGTSALTWAAPTAGGGNVGDINAVTASELETLLEGTWTGGSGVAVTVVAGALKVETVAVGASVTLEIKAGTANSVVGFTAGIYNGVGSAAVDTLKIWGKYDGAYANSLLIKIAAATSGEASEFNLQVIKNSVVIESFANLTMDDTADRFVETVVNHVDSGSEYITAEDLDAALGTPTADRPANVSGATMASGDDGLTSLDYNDFIGNQAAATGLYAFDLSDDITIFACPDNQTANYQKGMIQYCEVERNGLVFAILDPQASLNQSGILAQLTALGAEANTEYAALYWPRVKIINPSKPTYGSFTDAVTMAPSGMIAGIMATNDREEPEGPFFNPAGTEGGKPFGVVDVEMPEVKREPVRDIVYPKRINPITWMRGYGVFVDGSRTLKGDGNFPSVGERRGVSHIERLLKDGLQWVRHRPNTPALRRAVHKTVYAELHSWMRRGAFATNNPSTAFFVDVSEALNPPSVVRAGKLVMRIGLNTNAAAEFVIIKVTKDTRALDEELFGQG